MLANGTGFFYWGGYSAYFAAAYALASSVDHRRGVIGVALSCIVMHSTLGALQIGGWLGEHGPAGPVTEASQAVLAGALGAALPRNGAGPARSSPPRAVTRSRTSGEWVGVTR